MYFYIYMNNIIFINTEVLFDFKHKCTWCNENCEGLALCGKAYPLLIKLGW